MDWVGIVTAGVLFSGTIVGYQTLLHQKRTEADHLDRIRHDERARAIDSRFDQVDQHIEKFDGDMDGLTRQIATIVSDFERRFLPRSEHAEAIQRLDRNVVQLTEAIGGLSKQLFDLARGNR